LAGKGENDFLTRNEINACRFYLSAIAKILMEYEKQSKMLYRFAVENILAQGLYSKANQILLFMADAGGFASPQMISCVLKSNGKKPHVNIHDDLKQLYDREILFKESRGVLMLAPLKRIMSNIRPK
jgi:hypothetical protein